MPNDEPSNPGELREDIPLRPSDSVSFAKRFGGLKLIIASFVVLSLAVTIALATQIYYGDYEVVPHGSVATDSQECSSIGTDILKSGGNAVDAAIAASFCLSVVNQHVAGLDATGTMMIYYYRRRLPSGSSPALPIVIDFTSDEDSNVPQLIKGLAFIHSRFGSMDWSDLVLPAAKLAINGFSVPNSLFMASQTIGNLNLFDSIQPGRVLKLPILASFLYAVANSSVNSFIPSPSVSGISTTEATSFDIGDSTVYMPLKPITSKLTKFLNFSHVQTEAKFQEADVVRTATNLRMIFQPSPSSSSTISVIDKDEIYVSLVIGLESLLGSQRFASGGFILNDLPKGKPANENNYMPIIVTSEYTCGRRIVLSCAAITGAAQVIDNLLRYTSPDQLVAALENPRLQTSNGSNIAYERSHTPIFNENTLDILRSLGPLLLAPEPYPTCNAVQQFGDDLISHSDSRGGGISSRF